MLAFPPCKINLGLQVLHKRADGFHELATVMVPVLWTDVLEIMPLTDQPQGTCTFTQSGIGIPGSPDQNLCIKAYRLLQKDFQLPAIQMHLHKMIPFGAGLGGGSSDAAHTLLLLNQIFQLKLREKALLEYAAALGSDCAVFILNKPCLASGRGEILAPLPVIGKNFQLLLVKPSFGISTAEAYANVHKQEGRELPSTLLQRPVSEWKTSLENDFEQHLFLKYPELGRIKNQLYEAGALYAAMSGSGSTLFGLFDPEHTTFPTFPGCQVFSTGLQL